MDETWPCGPHNFKAAATVRCVANSLANFSLMPASYRTRYVRSYKAAYCSFQTCLSIMQPLIGHGLRLRAALARSWLMAGCATPRYAGQAGWWGCRLTSEPEISRTQKPLLTFINLHTYDAHVKFFADHPYRWCRPPEVIGGCIPRRGSRFSSPSTGAVGTTAFGGASSA